MNNDVQTIVSAQRDQLHEWVCTRFNQLMKEQRIDDAMCFADEWFEWLDPDQLEEEETLFSNEEEIIGYYEELINE